MDDKNSRRVWVEVDLQAIARNYRHIAKNVGPAKVMAVLKANAYGLGVLPIAQALIEAGVFRIGVSGLKEALPIAKSLKFPVQIIEGILQSEIPEAVRYGIICPVTDYATARLISREAGRQKKQATVHFLIDTGMGRLGMPHFACVREIRKALSLPHLVPEGIFSHFPNANNPTHPKTNEQLTLFKTIQDELSGVRFPLVHIANSDAINNFTSSYFNMVRTGINLYGVFDLSGRRAYHLQPTLSLKTRLIAKRMLPAGFTIGYGCTHVLFHDTLVGTIPAGYADGIPMSASNSGRVLVRGMECPILGRISMDYTTIDLTSVPDVRLGAEIVIIGRSGKKEITVEDWAKNKQSHPYDIICSLGSRVERVYI